MGLGDYGIFNEIDTKIVQGENIENARSNLCFEWPIHILKLPSASLYSSTKSHFLLLLRQKGK
jgi:hypothetical protein